MKRSVVTHPSPAWCRNHRATSRCTAGHVLRRDCSRGGTRVARASLPRLRLPLPLFQPAQQAGGPHHGHGMPLTPRPQAALVLVPAQRPRGRLVKLCARMLPLGQAGQRFPRGLRRQVAPAILPRLGRPPGGLRPPSQPAWRYPSRVTRQQRTATTCWRHPPVGPCRQRMVRHCQRGTVWSPSSARHSRLVAPCRSRTAKSVRPATPEGACRASKPASACG